MRNLIRPLAAVVVCTGLALNAGACGSPKDPPVHTAAPTTTVVTMLPKPSGTPIVDITRAGAEPVAADFAALDELATKKYEIVEPFEKKLINFSGVELWTILSGAGVPATATTVRISALDDYVVELSVADIRNGGVILATRADGELIPLDHGGPVRLVFLDGVEAGRNPDQWIWSLAHVVVT